MLGSLVFDILYPRVIFVCVYSGRFICSFLTFTPAVRSVYKDFFPTGEQNKKKKEI